MNDERNMTFRPEGVSCHEISEIETRLHLGLKWIVKARWLGILCIFLIGNISVMVSGLGRPDVNANFLGAIVIFYNLLFTLASFKLPKERLIKYLRLIINIILMLDIIIISALIHIRGGVESFAYLYYAIVLIFAIFILPKIDTLLLASFSTLCYTFVVLGEYYKILPHFSPELGMDFSVASNFSYVLASIMRVGGIMFLIAILGKYLTGYLMLREIELLKRTKELEDINKKLLLTQKELNIANVELKKLSQIKSDFVANVSHELRTPLTVIDGFLSFLLSSKNSVLQERYHKLLIRAKENSSMLIRLINDLLDIAKIESGKLILKKKLVRLSSVLNNVVENFRPLASEKKIVITNTVSKKLPEVFADPNQLNHLISNILSNAIKYTNPNGRITITGRVKNDMIEIAISDTGIGIPPDCLEKIFEKFFQVDSPYKKGAGLGLSICKAIVDAHKGRIWAESKEGEGSTFFFELPIEKKPQERIVALNLEDFLKG